MHFESIATENLLLANGCLNRRPGKCHDCKILNEIFEE
jgi:hypothetical protein